MPDIILVNEQDEPIGTMDKMEAHQKGLLHRAFSVFIFNSKREMLLQQRSMVKYHSAGLWTNACCSHPLPGEDVEAAAHRRLNEELGFDTALKKAFHFTYKTFFDNGLIEYEYDHVFTGTYNDLIKPNENEVKEYCFASIKKIRNDMLQQPQRFTEWFKIAFPMMEECLEMKTN